MSQNYTLTVLVSININDQTTCCVFDQQFQHFFCSRTLQVCSSSTLYDIVIVVIQTQSSPKTQLTFLIFFLNIHIILINLRIQFIARENMNFTVKYIFNGYLFLFIFCIYVRRTMKGTFL